MHMVVDVLARHDGGHAAGALPLHTNNLVLELGLLGSDAALHFLWLVMFERAMLDGNDVVVVLLRQSRGVMHRLYGGVEVLLMDFLVDSWLHILVLSAADGLVSDGWSDLGMGSEQSVC